MLRKHNKLIMLLVLVTFMFTMVASASAATFSDVSGTSTQTAAVYRLNSLGIIDGYPDGTFGPDKTITRAEFAKIACVTAGLKSVASGMTSTASPFSDVATDNWANGWINVAAAQGFVKGDPAGTFRPEANITQAEAITVLMRLLGYNDNLPGNWPSDYIAKAANLGDLDDVTFVADQAATRGTIAILTSAVLDENVVAYKASDNIFENEASGNTLLADNFTSTSSDPALVYDLNLSGGDRAIKVLDPAVTDAAKIKANIADGNFVSYKLTDDCVISGATSILGVAGRYVEYTLNKDGDVSYIKVRNDSDYAVVAGLDPSKIKRVDANTIKLDSGKSYNIASNFDTYSSFFPGAIYTSTGYSAGSNPFDANKPVARAANTGFLGTAVAASALTGKSLTGTNGQYLDSYLESSTLLATETADLTLDKDGNVAYVNFTVYPTNAPYALDLVQKVGIIDTVNQKTAKVSLKGQGSFTLDPDDAGNQVVIINGVEKTYQDLAANEMVWELNLYNTDLVVAMSMTAAGTLNSYEPTTFAGQNMVSTVTVGDKTYDVIKGGGYISTDEGDTYSDITTAGAITTDLDDSLGGDATVYLSPTMQVAAILAGTGTGTSSDIYGVINDTTANSLVNGKVTKSIEVQLKDGTYATYAPDSDSQIKIAGAAVRDMTSTDVGTNLVDDQFVKLSLNSDGYIDTIKTGSAIKGYTDFGKAGAATTITGDKDAMTITINGNTYDTSKAVVYNTSLTTPADDNQVDTVDLTQFMKDADSTIAGSTGIYAKLDGGAIQYLVFNNPAALGSTNNLAIVTGKGTNSDGAYVKLMTTGDAVQYTIKGTPAVSFAKGTVVNYSLVSGDAKIVDMGAAGLDWNLCGAAPMAITKISGNIFTIDGTNYSVDSDTLYFDFSNDDPTIATKGDFAVDDNVLVYQDVAGSAIKAIVLLK